MLQGRRQARRWRQWRQAVRAAWAGPRAVYQRQEGPHQLGFVADQPVDHGVRRKLPELPRESGHDPGFENQHRAEHGDGDPEFDRRHQRRHHALQQPGRRADSGAPAGSRHQPCCARQYDRPDSFWRLDAGFRDCVRISPLLARPPRPLRQPDQRAHDRPGRTGFDCSAGLWPADQRRVRQELQRRPHRRCADAGRRRGGPGRRPAELGNDAGLLRLYRRRRRRLPG